MDRELIVAVICTIRAGPFLQGHSLAFNDNYVWSDILSAKIWQSI